jgi:hypothetical protein
MEPGTFLVLIIIVAVIVIIIKFAQSSNKDQAEQTANDKINAAGIQHSIIKQETGRVYIDSFSMPQGVLVLTWDKFFFFGTNQNYEIPITSIRSTSSEQKSGGTNLVILADSGTIRFWWQDNTRAVPGIASIGDGIATGMGVATSANPNVQGWIQIIDDLRLGRLKKPD